MYIVFMLFPLHEFHLFFLVRVRVRSRSVRPVRFIILLPLGRRLELIGAALCDNVQSSQSS